MSPEEKQQKLAELNARLEAAKKELAKRKKQKETGDQSAPGVPPEVEAKARQYENAADAIMEFDPAMALKYRQQAEAIRNPTTETASNRDPETIRFKLISNLNALNARIANADSGDVTLPSMQKLAAAIQNEIRQGLPSAQRAYELGTQSDAALQETNEAYTPIEVAKDGTPVPPADIPDGVTIQNGVAIRNQKESTTPSDWFKMVEEDGASKPTVHSGLNKINMPKSVEDKFDVALEKWSTSNNSYKESQRQAAANEKGKAVAKMLSAGIPKTAEKLGEIAQQLTSLISKYNSGDYNLANFADLKGTMADGRMTDSDVGLALGLSASEGFFQNLKSWATGGKGGIEKLNDKDAAREAINRTIDQYNRTIGQMRSPTFTGQYKDEASKAWQDMSYSSRFSHLTPSFSKLPGGASSSTPSPAGPKNAPDAENDPLGIL